MINMQDAFGPHETGGQPYDPYSHDEHRENNRVAYGFVKCFLEKAVSDDEYAWAVAHRSLVESWSILLGEKLGPRWRAVLGAIAAEAASARWRQVADHKKALAELQRKIDANS